MKKFSLNFQRNIPKIVEWVQTLVYEKPRSYRHLNAKKCYVHFKYIKREMREEILIRHAFIGWYYCFKGMLQPTHFIIKH